MPYTTRILCLCIMALGFLSTPALAVKPTDEELSLTRRWVTANFEPVRRAAKPSCEPAAEPKPGLVVLANHDRVLVNGRPDGRPLKIAKTEYARGLLCHAVSRIVVRLPGPGKTFTSTVGVDANAGGGTIVFSVKVGGREKFRSEVLRGGGPALVEVHGLGFNRMQAGEKPAGCSPRG